MKHAHLTNAPSHPLRRLPLVLAGFLALAGPAPAQVNPGGLDPDGGLESAFSLHNPFGANPGEQAMKSPWIAPSDVGDPAFSPRCGQRHDGLTLPGIDFGGTALATGYSFGGLVDPATPEWMTAASLQSLYGAVPGYNLPVGDLIDYQAMINHLNSVVVPAFPGTTSIPGDNGLAVATTYVDNRLGAPLPIWVCTASDDSIQVWVNNVCVTNVATARGASLTCQERNPAILPQGISKITTLVWEGGGGWGFRLGLELANGTPLTDGNGLVEFLGADCPDTGLTGQVQYLARRLVPPNPLNCPSPRPIEIGLQGTSPPGFAGAPGDLLTIVETVRAQSPVAVTDISHGGVHSDWLALPAPPIGSLFRSTVGNDAGGSSNTLHHGGDAFTSISTTGGDIGDGGDDFAFAYTRFEGDFDVVVRIDARSHSTGLGALGRHGLMARRSLARDSHFVMVQDHLPLAPGDPPRMVARRQHEAGAGGMVQWLARGIASPVSYMRLRRVADIVTGWFSNNAAIDSDPTNDAHWTLVRNETVSAHRGPGNRYFVGFANSENASGGVATQTVAFTLLHLGGTQTSLAEGQTITWNGLPRSEFDAGIHYTVHALGTTAHAGEVAGEVARIDGHDALLFNALPTGPLGAFDNAHDIGAPRLAGSTTYTPGTDRYAMSVGGGGIEASDEFHFAYKAVSGDFVAEARITNRTDPVIAGPLGRHGLMARHSCDPTAKYSMIETMLVSPENSVGLPRHGFRTTHLQSGGIKEPYLVDDDTLPGDPGSGDNRIDRRPTWMRLVRIGGVLYSFLSFEDQDGEPHRWCLVGSDSDPARPETLLVGMALTPDTGGNAVTGGIEFDRFRCLPRPPGFPDAEGGTEVLSRSFDAPGDLGLPVVRSGIFTPQRIGDRLRITHELVTDSSTAMWFGVAADPGSGGAPLAASGFTVEFDAYFARVGVGSPGSDPNPAEGMTLTVIGSGVSDGGATLGSPWPSGLSPASLGGDGPNSLGFGGGTLLERTECHPNIALEIDTWRGGGNNEPSDSGSPNNDGTYHLGIDVNASMDSVQTNIDFGRPTASLPNLFHPAGVHFEFRYSPTGNVRVWAQSNGPGTRRTQFLDANVHPLPAGDLLIGFTGSTSGFTCTQEIDNLRIVSHAGDGMSDSWEQANGLDPEVDDAHLDPDCDTIPNAFEFYFGLPPRIANALPLQLIQAGSEIQLVYPRNKEAAGLPVVFETTTDLAVWNSVASTTTVLQDLGARELVRTVIPVGTAARTFARLRMGDTGIGGP